MVLCTFSLQELGFQAYTYGIAGQCLSTKVSKYVLSKGCLLQIISSSIKYQSLLVIHFLKKTYYNKFKDVNIIIFFSYMTPWLLGLKIVVWVPSVAHNSGCVCRSISHVWTQCHTCLRRGSWNLLVLVISVSHCLYAERIKISTEKW